MSLDQTLNIAEIGGPAQDFLNIHSDAHYRGNIARIGVNYKFY